MNRAASRISRLTMGLMGRQSHDNGGFSGWALEKERLFTIVLNWQKVVMMTQLFEYIVTNVASVRKDIMLEE